jgi:hypothetical protein
MGHATAVSRPDWPLALRTDRQTLCTHLGHSFLMWQLFMTPSSYFCPLNTNLYARRWIFVNKLKITMQGPRNRVIGIPNSYSEGLGFKTIDRIDYLRFFMNFFTSSKHIHGSCRKWGRDTFFHTPSNLLLSHHFIIQHFTTWYKNMVIPDPLWGPLSLLTNKPRGSFAWDKTTRV